MSDGGASAPSACWNCRQPLTAGATRCIWCGVSLTASAAPLVVAPGAATPTSAAIPPAPAVAMAAPAVPTRSAPAASRAVPERGTSAGAAPRLVAVTVDLILLVVAGVAAYLLSRNLLLGAAVLAEVLLLLWILDARTGATPGKALVRLRTALPGGTMSPGAGRSFGRGALTGAGLLVGGVGAWVVAASAAFDPWRRGWADRATDTVTVLVPSRGALPAALAPSAVAPAPAAAPSGLPPVPGALPPLPPSASPVLPALPVVPPIEMSVIAEPRVVNIATPRPAVDEESASGDVVAAWAPAVATPVVPSGGDAAEESGVSLLLVFDTGQRVTFAAPVAVNLGRNPAATTEGDRLVSVDDPESTVSKTHARLEHSRGATWITDGGSTNGTEILSDEGVATPLAAGRRTLLGEGDRVRLGRRVFTVSVLIEGSAG
jgi:hypothetical protein